MDVSNLVRFFQNTNYSNSIVWGGHVKFPVGTAMRAYVRDMYVVRKLHTYVIGHGKVMV